MPVSKKRKKDGKPVHRKLPAAAPSGEQGAAVEAHPSEPQARTGKPSNPFVAQ